MADLKKRMHFINILLDKWLKEEKLSNEELGEKLIDICLAILGKAVKLTKTDMDDQLLEAVAKAIKAREEEAE